MMTKQTEKIMAQEVSLIELLRSVPENSRLIVDSKDGLSSRVHPIGFLCHKAAKALEQPSVAELNDEYLRDTHVEGLQPAQEPVAWISVDDKLPEFVTVNNYEKSSDDILILIDGKHVYVGSWIYDNWSKTNDFCMRDLDGGYEVVDGMKVTHWMPLPKAPNEINTHTASSWQGLSYDEITQLKDDWGIDIDHWNDFARDIEQALKEKNT